MKRNQVILIHGLPASGKYTIAKKIQEKCGGVLLDNHYFFDLFAGMTEVPDEEWNKYTVVVGRVRRDFLDVLRKHYPKKQPIRYIFTSVVMPGEKLPGRLQKLARDIQADFIPIELVVRRDELLNRCDAEQRRKRNKLTNKKKYEKLLNQIMSRAFHSHSHNKLVLDTSDLSVDETFSLVKKHLKKFD